MTTYMLNTGDIFTLLDETWGLLFPSYYKPIRNTQMPRHIARVKVVDINYEGIFLLMLMELVPEEGMVHIPTNVTTTCTQFAIDDAIALSEAKRNLL